MKSLFAVLMVLVAVSSASAQTSGVKCEYWMGVTLSNPADLANNPNMFGAPSTTSSLLSGFVAPSNKAGAPFVARCTAKLNVPVTGNYLFWVAANKLATVWIGSSADFVGQNYLCRVSASYPTPLAKQWTRNAEQKSVPVSLTAGANYYLQVIHVATGAVNHMAVGWMLPSGVYERPIPKSRLTQVNLDYTPPSVAITSPTASQTVYGVFTATVAASDNVGVAGVQFKLDGNNLGTEVVSAPYSLDVDSTTTADGLYTISAVARDAMGNLATTTPVRFVVGNNPDTLTNPGGVEFDPSLEHDILFGDVPAVTNYTLGVYFIGAAEPVSSVDIGKPSRDYDGKIRYLFSSGPVLISTPIGTFQARVAAVGPGGVGISDFSNTFVVIR